MFWYLTLPILVAGVLVLAFRWFGTWRPRKARRIANDLACAEGDVWTDRLRPDARGEVGEGRLPAASTARPCRATKGMRTGSAGVEIGHVTDVQRQEHATLAPAQS